jgi:membrane associated rhomboid family serine protease
MSTAKGLQQTTARWDAFALASAAPLGPFVRAHLAPRIPPELLNSALVNFLSLHDDELLLAIIDSGGPKPTRSCALTTRRVYWTERIDRSQESKRARMRSLAQPRTHELVARFAGYADLPECMRVVESVDGSSGIELGNGMRIVVGEGEGALASTVLHYLETMRSATRAGELPEGVIDADLAGRVARALPAVVKMTAAARPFGQDLLEFGSSLHATAHHSFVTPTLLGACVLVYAAMVASGVPWLLPSTDQLLRWGASGGNKVVLDREYWRLATTMFLHVGLIHLTINMWSLFVVGPLVERLYGNLAYAVIYLASGVGGAIASLAASSFRVGVGASGAICGILGALVAFLIVHRRAIPKSILKSFRAGLIAVAILMAILGYFVPNIDHQAHLGGLGTGFLSGLLLTRPWPVVKSRWIVLRHAAAILLIVASLTAAAALLTRGASATPSAHHQSVGLEPALVEFDAITAAAPATLVLRRDRADIHARAQLLKDVRALIGRGVANQKAVRGMTTSDPHLRKLLTAFREAQASQLNGLRAAERFLETGDIKHISGEGGMLESITATGNAIRSFHEAQSSSKGEKTPIRTDRSS